MSEFDDILVAIHGIGAQSRNSTVRSVATRLAQSSASNPKDLPPVAPQPLGWFYTDVRGAVKVNPLDSFDDPKHSLGRIGFTEVFWADIPQEVVDEGRTIEETKAWARTVVARARAICKKKIREEEALSPAQRSGIIEPDFGLAAEVLEEIIETVYVLENLTFLAEKAGLMKFDLKRVLEEYLGDVQIVTEFTLFRRDIIGRFQSALTQIHREYPDANLHIIAHSEGTVVSFLGLLHALSGERLLPGNAEGGAVLNKLGRVPDWLSKLKGYMTIGSPIDKHILLWPKLFKDFDFNPARELFSDGRRIQWRNYYDYGDPVGFRLDTARCWLEKHRECTPFEFEEKHDIGFARYVMPGKAHNDYWEDRAVFDHFISDVIEPIKDAPKPCTRPAVYALSPLIPYAISFMLLAAGTFILYRSVTDYTHPGLDALQRYVRFVVLGLSEQKESVSGLTMLLHTLGIAGLLGGITLLARIPRLAVGWFWKIIALLGFGVGCLSYYFGVGEDSRMEIGSGCRLIGLDPTIGVLVLGFIVALVSVLFVLIPSHEFGRPGSVPRKQRWIFKGMRPLMLAGALAVGFLILSQFLPHSDLTVYERTQLAVADKELARAADNAHLSRPKELARAIDSAHLSRPELNMMFYAGSENNFEPRHVKNITEILTVHSSVWPVLLCGAAFLYLWWLAALIFDLGFVWHRYIRHSLSNKRLMLWSGYPPRGQTTHTAPKSDGQAELAPVAASEPS
jgi:hypothetical protein